MSLVCSVFSSVSSLTTPLNEWYNFCGRFFLLETGIVVWLACVSFASNFTWWRHQMETFSALLSLCVRNSPVTGEFPSQRLVTRSFDVFCAWINSWVNNCMADDLRHHRAHYDVIVMTMNCTTNLSPWLHHRWIYSFAKKAFGGFTKFMGTPSRI